MKKVLFFLALVFSWGLTKAQNVGIGTLTPHPSARVDVVDSVRGVLLPRVALTGTNSAAPITDPENGLLVYNIATSGSYPLNVSPGFYYWNGSRWIPLVEKGNAVGDMQYWDGTKWVLIPIGPNGSVLTVCGGLPTWGPCPQSTLTLSPANNPYEGVYLDYYPSIFFYPNSQILIEAWTNGGSPWTARSCLKFDLSSLPPGAIIDTAKLYLYADPAPGNGNFIDAMYGPSNACYIQRITSNWTLPTPFSWNNPPSVTTVNQAIIPQSNSSFENSVVVVTQLVKDMVQFGNNGFHLKLINEVTYNIRQYVSSTYANAAMRPKLVIVYH